ncbi:MAG: site-2 protease family protein [Candidatus Sumerlaeia bacterium]
MIACPECAAELDEGALACPHCGALAWRDRLRALHRESAEAEAAGDYKRSLEGLHACLELLPAESRQHAQIEREIARLAYLDAKHPAPPAGMLVQPEADRDRESAAGNVFAALRLAFVGLLKPRTLGSLALWTVCLGFMMGWMEAFLFGLLIYVHEMGHLIAIEYYGYQFAWPVFVPFLGAFVLHGKTAQRPVENAAIAFAGPLAGSMASFALVGLDAAVGLPELIRNLAYINLLINFLNLMPYWMLDGSRLAGSISRGGIVATAGALCAAAALGWNGYALIMALGWIGGIAIHWGSAGKVSRAADVPRLKLRAMEGAVVAVLIVSALLLEGLRRG